VPLPGPNAPSRKVPRAELGAFRTLEGSDTLRPLSPIEIELDDLRLPPSDAMRCVGLGGCFDQPTDGDDTTCRLPCPAQPAPLPPAEPALPAPPAPPAPAADVVMTPCRAGWATVAATPERPATCAPPSRPATVICAPTEAQKYGAATCAPIGTPCGAGEFAAPPLGEVVRYVRAGLGDVGDGSLATPYGDLETAATASPPGTVLLLGKGRHLAPVQIARRLTLQGACSAETELVTDPTVAIHLLRSGIVLRDLAVLGGTFGIAVVAGASVELDGVRAEGGSEAQLYVSGSAVVRGSLFRGGGYAVVNTVGGSLDIEDSVLDEARFSALISQGGMLTADRLSVRGGAGLRAIEVSSSSGAISRVDLSGGTFDALDIISSTIALDDVAIRGDPTAGRGLYVGQGSRVTASGLSIADREGCVVFAGDRTTRLELVDTRIENSLDGGINMLCANGSAEVIVRRVHVSNGHNMGVSMAGSSRLGGGDLWIEGIGSSTRAPGMVENGHGLVGAGGTRVDLSRVRIERVRQNGISVFELAATASISDVVLRDVRSRASQAGEAIRVTHGARAAFSRVRVDVAGGGAVDADDEGTQLIVSDLTAHAPNSGVHPAIAASDGALLELHRVDVEAPGARGISVDKVSTAAIFDLRYEAPTDVIPGADQSCLEVDGAISGARLRFESCPHIAVHIDNDGTGALTDVEVIGGGAKAGVQAQGPLEIDRVRVSGVSGPGLFVSRPSDTIARDVTVIGPQGALIAGNVTLTRARFEGGGLTAEGEDDKMATFEDIAVKSAAIGLVLRMTAGVARARIDDSAIGAQVLAGTVGIIDLDVAGCPTGLSVIESADADVARFRIDRATEAGISLSVGSRIDVIPALDLSRGTISRSRVGIDVLLQSYDLARLIRDVALTADQAAIKTP